jgi:hypothetical protein
MSSLHNERMDLHRFWKAEPEFLNFYGAQEMIPKIQFRQGLCSLEGRYDNPIPTRLLAPVDCLKIPPQITMPEEDWILKDGYKHRSNYDDI